MENTKHKTNAKFAQQKENDCYEKLTDFNNFLNIVQLGRCPDKSSTDASGYTTDGRYANIELKDRDMNLLEDFRLSGETKGKTYYAEDLFIESHKVADMMLDYQCEGKLPLYINFINEDTVILYNLATLKHRPKKVSKRIWSELYQGFEIAKRQCLNMDDAWIYKKINGKYTLIKGGHK